MSNTYQTRKDVPHNGTIGLVFQSRYLKNGAKTPWFHHLPDYGYFPISKLLGGLPDERGALFKNTIYWKFVGEEIYN